LRTKKEKQKREGKEREKEGGEEERKEESQTEIPKEKMQITKTNYDNKKIKNQAGFCFVFTILAIFDTQLRSDHGNRQSAYHGHAGHGHHGPLLGAILDHWASTLALRSNLPHYTAA
jgi:hypothetical protein